VNPKKAGPAALVRAVKCSKCGAPIELRSPSSLSVACGSCGSVLDPRTPDLALIAAAAKRQEKYRPRIPLGHKGRLKGEVFQCIGYMARRTKVDGQPYTWHEYLLFNPYKGYRWLVEYQGHWTSVKPAHVTPEASATGGLRFFGEDYRHFQSCRAEVVFVVGEFYWQVRVGDSAELEDYVCPPSILSIERTADETSCSVGTYVTGQEVWQAFQLPGEPPETTGVAPAQPSPIQPDVGKSWALFAALCLVTIAIHSFVVSISQNKRIWQGRFNYDAAEAEKSKVTEVFEITGRTSNVVIKTSARVDNHWLFAGYALINEGTGVAIDFGREVSYYHGYDGGESWAEGSTSDEVVIPQVPAGRYYLRVEPQSDTSPVLYEVEVWRDVPQLFPLLMSWFILAIPALIASLRQYTFEVRRWSESDHPMITTEE
jgi:DNA-directed RNA polymerase subunit RPC12/RpoP